MYDKREESRDVGEHTGQDERVFGVVVQHGLQQLHALIDGQLLHGKRQRERGANVYIIIVHIICITEVCSVA